MVAQRRELLTAGGLLLGGVAVGCGGPARAGNVKEGDSCIGCAGAGVNPCFRCKGTGKVEGKLDCLDCQSTGFKVCGACYATGLSKARRKVLFQDATARNIVNRACRILPDDKGRLMIRDEVTKAIAEYEARTGVPV